MAIGVITIAKIITTLETILVILMTILTEIIVMTITIQIRISCSSSMNTNTNNNKMQENEEGKKILKWRIAGRETVEQIIWYAQPRAPLGDDHAPTSVISNFIIFVSVLGHLA